MGWPASRKKVEIGLGRFLGSDSLFNLKKAQFGSQICFGVDFEKPKKLDLEHLYLLLGSSFLMVTRNN